MNRRKKKKVRPLAYVLLALIVVMLGALIVMICGGFDSLLPPETEEGVVSSTGNQTDPPKKTNEKPMGTNQSPVESKPPVTTAPPKLDAYEASAGYQKDIRARYESYAALYPALDTPTVVKYVNMGLDRPFYQSATPVEDPASLTALVNKYSFLPSDYIPSDLVTLKYKISGRNVQMRAEAAEAFHLLCEAAKEEGLSILGYSGYRSYSYQNNLYNNYCKNDPQEVVDTYSARPGYSEHQTGLAIDVCTKNTAYNDFGNTKEYTWSLENMHRFGFILSYPETENVPGAEKDTYLHGYKLEEWHFRYVGVELATYLYQNDLLLDEHYALQGDMA